MYGDGKDVGNCTPYIADCFSPHVTSCILDGEMVGFNGDTKTIGKISLGVRLHFMLTLMLKFCIKLY